ncbi:MAG: hypothetical protein AB1925_04765 [Actinomycetota bacterium]
MQGEDVVIGHDDMRVDDREDAELFTARRQDDGDAILHAHGTAAGSQDGEMALTPLRVFFRIGRRLSGAGPAPKIAESIFESDGQSRQLMKSVGDRLLAPTTAQGGFYGLVDERPVPQLSTRGGQFIGYFRQFFGGSFVTAVKGSASQRSSRLVGEHHQHVDVLARRVIGAADDECALDDVAVLKGKRPTPLTAGYLHRTVPATVGDELIHVYSMVQVRGQSIP